jgi:flagellar basal-body rod protein FlgC
MINPLSVPISGLMSSSKKASVAASNIANADVTGSTDVKSSNQAYKPQDTLDISVTGGGVKTVSLDRNPSFIPSYEPNSPFANSEGLVNSPNVNLDEELINLKIAENAYKANITALKAGISMQDTLQEALDTKS